MRRIRYGMIGGGRDSFIGAVHRAAMRLDDGWELVCGALSSSPEKARASAADLGLPGDRAYGSWAEMIEAESARDPADRMEAVVIVTPNDAHAGPAGAALRAGFHVVCDKPLCTSVEDADRLEQLTRRSGLIFAVTYNYTGYPMVRQARRMVLDGEIGPVRRVLIEYTQGWLATGLERTGHKQAAWRTDPARAGAGAIGDIGSHAEHLARYITGLEPDAVLADLSSFVPGRAVDDDAAVLIRYREASGVRARGVLVASQIAVGRRNDLSIRVFGETGGLEWRQESPDTLVVDGVDGPTRVLHRGGPGLCGEARDAAHLPPGHPEGYFEAFANIYRGVRRAIEAGGGGGYPTVADGAHGVRFIHKAQESSAAGGVWVSL